MSKFWYSVKVIENQNENTYFIPFERGQVDLFKSIKNVLNQNIGKNKYIVIDIEPTSSCFGCRIDAPDQISHMEEGGCLYQDDLDDDIGDD